MLPCTPGPSSPCTFAPLLLPPPPITSAPMHLRPNPAPIPPQTNASASPSQRDFSLHEAMGVAPPSRQAPRLGSAGTQRRVVEDKERGRLQSHVLRELLESRNEVAQAGQSFDAQAAASR